MRMTIRLHRGDLPDLSRYTAPIGRGRDRYRDHGARSRTATGCAWCSFRRATAPPTWCRFRRTPKTRPTAPNLKRLLADKSLLKIFHFARFDLGMLYKAFGVMPEPVYCTKIASRLARTYTDKHGLKDLVREVLGQDLSKQQQSSDWGAGELSDAQVAYAAADVTHLHALKDRLDAMLAREGRERSGRGLFPLPAGAGAARPCRLCRRGYFRPFLSGAPNVARRALSPANSHQPFGLGATFAGDFCETKPLKAWSNVRIRGEPSGRRWDAA